MFSSSPETVLTCPTHGNYLVQRPGDLHWVCSRAGCRVELDRHGRPAPEQPRTCDMCRRPDVSVRLIGLFINGSESYGVCPECERRITDFVRQEQALYGHFPIDRVKRRKGMRPIVVVSMSRLSEYDEARLRQEFGEDVVVVKSARSIDLGGDIPSQVWDACRELEEEWGWPDYLLLPDTDWLSVQLDRFFNRGAERVDGLRMIVTPAGPDLRYI